MLQKLTERREREVAAMQGDKNPPRPSGDSIVSDKELFRQLGNKVKVVKAP